MGICSMAQGAQLGVLWWPKGVGGEVWSGREAQQEGDICTHVADSFVVQQKQR